MQDQTPKQEINTQIFTKLKRAVIPVIALFIVWLDRRLKGVASDNLGFEKDIIDGFGLHFEKNQGIAFSLPLPNDWAIYAATGILLIVFLFMVNIWKDNRYLTGSLVLVVLGGLSNLYDRWFHGGVIDYFNLANLTIFNLADAMIVAGVILFAVLVLKHEHD